METSRRGYLKASAALLGTVGIMAFPPGLTRLTEMTSSGQQRVTTTYQRNWVASIHALAEDQPADFRYPLEEHPNLVVKLGTLANMGVGPANDIVAFSYICSHMRCLLNGLYRSEHSMLGPCPCHLSRFDETSTPPASLAWYTGSPIT